MRNRHLSAGLIAGVAAGALFVTAGSRLAIAEDAPVNSGNFSVTFQNDFTTAYFVSSGAPALMTEVLATFGFRMSFDHGHPEIGVAAAMSALPLLIPLAILLIRRLQVAEMQL